jgi:hypothetical protein
VLEEVKLRSLVKGPLRLQVEETVRVRAEEKLRQQAGREQVAMWDRLEPRYRK